MSGLGLLPNQLPWSLGENPANDDEWTSRMSSQNVGEITESDFAIGNMQ